MYTWAWTTENGGKDRIEDFLKRFFLKKIASLVFVDGPGLFKPITN